MSGFLRLGEGCGREMEVTANWYEVSFWGYKNVLKLDCGDYCTTL